MFNFVNDGIFLKPHKWTLDDDEITIKKMCSRFSKRLQIKKKKMQSVNLLIKKKKHNTTQVNTNNFNKGKELTDAPAHPYQSDRM